MRVAIYTILALLGMGVVACDGKPLTGPEAQQAYARALSYLPAEHTDFIVPEGVIMYVNGQRVGPGQSLGRLPPDLIQRIEVLKGGAAAKLHGDEARNGVIRIYLQEPRSPAPAR